LVVSALVSFARSKGFFITSGFCFYPLDLVLSIDFLLRMESGDSSDQGARAGGCSEGRIAWNWTEVCGFVVVISAINWFLMVVVIFKAFRWFRYKFRSVVENHFLSFERLSMQVSVLKERQFSLIRSHEEFGMKVMVHFEALESSFVDSVLKNQECLSNMLIEVREDCGRLRNEWSHFIENFHCLPSEGRESVVFNQWIRISENVRLLSQRSLKTAEDIGRLERHLRRVSTFLGVSGNLLENEQAVIRACLAPLQTEFSAMLGSLSMMVTRLDYLCTSTELVGVNTDQLVRFVRAYGLDLLELRNTVAGILESLGRAPPAYVRDVPAVEEEINAFTFNDGLSTSDERLNLGSEPLPSAKGRDQEAFERRLRVAPADPLGFDNVDFSSVEFHRVVPELERPALVLGPLIRAVETPVVFEVDTLPFMDEGSSEEDQEGEASGGVSSSSRVIDLFCCFCFGHFSVVVYCVLCLFPVLTAMAVELG
jgi:hypothetical protein